MSAEAPVIVVGIGWKNLIGGAAVVAAHVRALGANCDFITVVGDDDVANYVTKQIIELNINGELVIDKSRPTTFKKRYIVENQKLFRVSRLEEHSLGDSIEEEVIKRLHKHAPKADGIIVSDFVYGVITPKIIDVIHKLSAKYDLKLFGDVQSSSQVGDVTNFKNFTLISPNEKEARIALHDKENGLEVISQKLLRKQSEIVMKLGADGFIVYEFNSKGDIISQAFPALSVNPVDVVGAGDSLLALFVAALRGEGMMTSAALGCCMAALAVEQMGNSLIHISALKDVSSPH